MKVTDFHPVLLREGDGTGKEKGRPAAAPTSKTETEDERSILCASCMRPITSKEHKLEINGAHHHTFFNPSGIVFEIGCFSQAQGCMPSGPPSTEFTWFKGFTWRYELCAGCFSHLGWLFESAGTSFHGLIIKKLTGG